MAINALSYLGVNSDNLPDWSDYATKNLGMQLVDRGAGALSFRMDDQKQRLAVTGEFGDHLAFMGWEVDSEDDLEVFAGRLEKAGIAVQRGVSELADKRFVTSLIHFNDPQGNRIELVYKPMQDDRGFIPGRPISGFKTGACGMGHAVLHTQNVDELVPFYRDILGFFVSDYSTVPISVYFFHVNERHHSFALIGTGRNGFHHFMIEYDHLDDVGQGYDLLRYKDGAIAYTLGRHTNDYMTSFYSHTPSGFFIETGWGGRTINPDTWVPEETDVGPSFWGHERLHMPDEMRLRFREKRLETAALGKQAPPMVDCPWLYSQARHPAKD